jgi:hypothetical protein
MFKSPKSLRGIESRTGKTIHSAFRHFGQTKAA